MTFRVGMPVKCIDNRGVEGLLAVGGTYTVRALDAWVYLAEIPGAWKGFLPSRFRPAVQPGISFDTSIPADPDSEQYDNRRRIPVFE